MKRSINSENIVVVTAIAIAVSLLASACGPGKMKTAISKGSAKVVKTQNEGETTTATTIETKEEVLKAVQEKQAQTTDQTPVDTAAVQELSERIALVKLNEDKDGNVDLVIRHLTKSGKDQKAYSTSFDKSSAVVDEATKTVSYSKAISREMIVKDGKTVFSETLTNDLPIKASITTHSKNFRTVRISETDAATKKTVSVDLIIKSNDLAANVQAEKDENVLKLKDKKFSITSTQMYLSSDALLHEKAELTLVNSRANKVSIEITDAKDENLAIDLEGKLSVSENSVTLTIVDDKVSTDTFGINNDDYTALLNSGDAVVISQTLALTLTNKKTSEASNISLTVTATKEETAAPADKEEEKEKEEVAAEETKTEDSATAKVANEPKSEIQSDVKSEESASKKNEKAVKSKDLSATKKSDGKVKAKSTQQEAIKNDAKKKTTGQKAAEIAQFGAKQVLTSAPAKTAAVLVAPQVAVATTIVKNSLPVVAAKSVVNSNAAKQVTATVTSTAKAVQSSEAVKTVQQTARVAGKIAMNTPQAKGAAVLVANNPAVVGAKMVYTAGKTATAMAVTAVHNQLPKTKQSKELSKAQKPATTGQAAKASLPTIQNHNSK